MSSFEDMSGDYVVLIREPSEEFGFWGADCPELPGCCSLGRTRDDLMENVGKAIKSFWEENPDFEVKRYDEVAWAEYEMVITGK